MISYQVGRRLLIGTAWRESGEPVPEAHNWRLVESLVRAGELDEVDVTVQELSASIQKYCPDEAEVIYARLGVQPYKPEPEPEVQADEPKPRRPRPPKNPILVELPEPLAG